MGQEEGGSLRAEYAYDAAGHRTKSRDGDGVEVSLSYGLEGQIRTLTTERAREAGRITAIHAPEGGKEEYTQIFIMQSYRIPMELKLHQIF